MQPQDTIPCAICGQPFAPSPHQRRAPSRACCSAACLNRSRGNPPVDCTCAQCGVAFQRLASELRKAKGTATYCSVACWRTATAKAAPIMAVYAIEHLASGRLYIGSTTHVDRRWHTHRSKLNCGTHENTVLQAAWTRDGEAAYAFRILEAVHDPAQLRTREQAWMDTHQSAQSAYGFNRNPKSTSGRGRVQLPAVVAKVSAANRGKQRSPETRAKISRAAMGNRRGVANLDKHNHFRSLSDAEAAEIKQALANGDYPTRIAADRGLTKHVVARIARGETYPHVRPDLTEQIRANRGDGRALKRKAAAP